MQQDLVPMSLGMGSASSPAWQDALSHAVPQPHQHFSSCAPSPRKALISAGKWQESTLQNGLFTPLELLRTTVAGMLKVSHMSLPSGMRQTASPPRWLSHSCGTGRLP